MAAVVMGVLCTAIPYTLWIEGTRRVRVEHVTILGYLEPVAGPIYAVFLVGQLPGAWTWVGGALILGAGSSSWSSAAARARLGRRGRGAGAALMGPSGLRCADQRLRGDLLGARLPPRPRHGSPAAQESGRRGSGHPGARRPAALPRVHARGMPTHRVSDTLVSRPGTTVVPAAQAREGARRDHPSHVQPPLAGPRVRPGPRRLP